jgi:hypothetical protein
MNSFVKLVLAMLVVGTTIEIVDRGYDHKAAWTLTIIILLVIMLPNMNEIVANTSVVWSGIDQISFSMETPLPAKSGTKINKKDKK